MRRPRSLMDCRWSMRIPADRSGPLRTNGYAAHQPAVLRGALPPPLSEAGIIWSIYKRVCCGLAFNLLMTCRFSRYEGGRYVSAEKASLRASKNGKAITYHSNCLVGDFHYFRPHHDFLIGRVNGHHRQSGVSAGTRPSRSRRRIGDRLVGTTRWRTTSGTMMDSSSIRT